MTEPERDAEISRRYRALDREEPPRALDEAILSAAHGEVETHPAPLVAPTARRRWYVPLAAAAVIVLSVVVTLQMQREQPDAELGAPPPSPPASQEDAVPAAPPAPAAPKAEAPRDKAAESRAAPPAAAAPRRSPAPASQAVQERPFPGPTGSEGTVVAPPGRAPAAPPRALEAPRSLERDRASGTSADALSKRAEEAEPPERWLERIAALRREGRAKEADELYAEFRRRYPEYRIPDAMRDQVLPR